MPKLKISQPLWICIRILISWCFQRVTQTQLIRSDWLHNSDVVAHKNRMSAFDVTRETTNYPHHAPDKKVFPIFFFINHLMCFVESVDILTVDWYMFIKVAHTTKFITFTHWIVFEEKYSCIPLPFVETEVPRVADHYNDVIMGVMEYQITSLTIVYSTVYSDADQRKHQSSALLAFVRGIHRWPVNSPHKWPVSRKMFPFDDVIM